MAKISEDGRRLLREACVANRQDSDLGNKIADWLDAHPNAQVYVTGQTPEPPLRVFGKPDEVPTPQRGAFGIEDAPATE